MKAQSQFLQSEITQTVESTFGISSSAMPGMNFRQSRRVTKRGLDREKSTRTIVDALVISVFLICLFLTGCSASMTGTPRDGGQSPIVLVGGETTLPGKVDSEAPPVAPAAKTDEALAPAVHTETHLPAGALKKFVEQDEVQDRVRIVTGWLHFVRQDSAANLVESGWNRLSAGKVVGPLKRDPVADLPNISISELMLWRQLVLKDEKAISADVQARLETLALMLTTSQSPDDLLRADKLLVVPDATAGY